MSFLQIKSIIFIINIVFSVIYEVGKINPNIFIGA